MKYALVKLGFSKNEADHLINHDYFHHSRKSDEELIQRFRDIAEVYDCTIKEVREMTLKFPHFAGLDHERVVANASKVYGDRGKVISAVMKFPQFAGLDHERVVRERIKLGRLVGLDRKEVIEKILANPVLAGYSAKRYIAGLDVGRQLAKEGLVTDEGMLDAYFSFVSKSPYVPGFKRKRISQAVGREPPLLKAMRKKLTRL